MPAPTRRLKREDPMATYSEQLAAAACSIRLENVPPEAVRRAVELVLDWLGNAAAGARSPIGRALTDMASRYGGRGSAHRVADFSVFDPLTAALVNAGCSHSLEFDDTHAPTLFHPGSPVISAALAMAEDGKAGGKDFLAGVFAGYEVSMRLAACVNPSHYRLWHTTGTIGTFGAAVAACRTANLDPPAVANAIGLAGTQAAGLWEVLPHAPSAKNLHPGKAAQGGLLAALLAKRGIEGPPTILEGARGFFRAMVPDAPKTEALLEDFGRKWRLLETTTKAYPICGHAMTPVEAALIMKKEVDPGQLEEITIFTNSTALRVAGSSNPGSEYQAKFSIPYCAAAALVFGQITQKEFGAEAMGDPRVRALMGRIRIQVDEAFDRGFDRGRPARIEAITKDGRKVATEASCRRGDPQNPLSHEEIRDKFHGLAGSVWNRETLDAVWSRGDRLTDIENMETWLAGLPVRPSAAKKTRNRKES